MDRLRLQLLQKSYAAVSMGVSSRTRSSHELARFLRSSERRKFASSQRAAEHDSALFHHADSSQINKEQK